MCLGIPGRIVGFVDETDQLARVDVAGVTRTVNVGLVREQGVTLGDWVLIHVGFAMSVIDEEEAARSLETLRLLGDPYETEVGEIVGSRIE